MLKDITGTATGRAAWGARSPRSTDSEMKKKKKKGTSRNSTLPDVDWQCLLGSLDYSICVRLESDMCAIQWIAVVFDMGTDGITTSQRGDSELQLIKEANTVFMRISISALCSSRSLLLLLSLSTFLLPHLASFANLPANSTPSSAASLSHDLVNALGFTRLARISPCPSTNDDSPPRLPAELHRTGRRLFRRQERDAGEHKDVRPVLWAIPERGQLRHEQRAHLE